MITKPPKFNPEHVGRRDTADPRFRSNERVTLDLQVRVQPCEMDKDRADFIERIRRRRQAQQAVR